MAWRPKRTEGICITSLEEVRKLVRRKEQTIRSDIQNCKFDNSLLHDYTNATVTRQ